MLKFRSCVLVASLVSAVFGVDEAVTKTWELTIPDADNGGCTNKAHVVLSDGSYQLKAWIISASSKTLGIGRDGDVNTTVGLAMLKDADNKWIGSGDLDMRGAITVGGAASTWKIVRFGQNAFHMVKAAPFDTFYCPTTLTSMANATFQQCGTTSGFNRFVLHAPEMTGDLPNNTFLNWSRPKIVDLKIPKVTCIGGYWGRDGYVDFLSDTDVSDWDLSSVQQISITGGNKKTEMGYFFRWSKFRGTMRLPGLKYLNPKTFEHCCNMNALEIGRNGNLEYVGRFAVTNCTALGSITLGGKTSGWLISTNAFYSANITNVTFLSVPPSYEEPDSIIFGTEATAARQIAFYIPPRGTPGWQVNWARYVKAARPATDAERAAFTTTFGAFAARGLVGVVAPEVFRTAREQWLVCGVPSTERFTVKAAPLDPRFEGDDVTISPLPDADGRYAAGTQVTLTAVPNTAKGRFVRWRGVGINEAEENNISITLTVDRDFDVTAQMAHDWTFYLDTPENGFKGWEKGVISNQIWKITVRVGDPVKGTLTYGDGANQGSAWTEMGEGMLDLNGPVYFTDPETEERRELTISDYNSQCFKGPYATVNSVYTLVIPTTRYPRALVLRENLLANPGQNFRNDGASSVTNLIFESSEFKGVLGTDGFCGYALNSGRLRLPKTPQVPPAYTISITDVDVSDWRLDSVTNVIGQQTGGWGVLHGLFAGKGDTHALFTGTLHLPALYDVQTNGFNLASNMEAIELGSNTVVTKIGTLAFNGCSSLARIRLRAGKDLTVGANAFTGTTKLKMLEFTYEMPTDPAAVDNMLIGSTESVEVSVNPPVIYASRLMGWNSGKTERIRRATDAEMAARPWWVKNDSSLIGVWVTADDVAKAWVVNVPCPEDPKGTFLFFR